MWRQKPERFGSENSTGRKKLPQDKYCIGVELLVKSRENVDDKKS